MWHGGWSRMSTDDRVDIVAPSMGLEEQAAALYIRQRSGDWTPLDQAALDAWLTDAAHARAYRAIQHAWRTLEVHSAAPGLIAFRGDALQRARRDRWTRGLRRGAGFYRRCAVGAFVALLFGLGLKILLGSLSYASYQTQLGERRVIELADRSQIVLDESTAIRVRMTRDARVVHLLDGQAQFIVAHDPRRPFLVEAGGNTITAVGTSFNVEYLGADMRIDMVEGKVVVAVAEPTTAPDQQSAGRLPAATAAPATDHTLDLAAGEELNVEPGGQTRIVRNADISAAIAWRQGKIIFKNTPLGEAARRLNRYSKVQLQISDTSLAQERISGVFDLGDTMVFAEAVQSSLPVVTRQAGPNLLILSPAP